MNNKKLTRNASVIFLSLFLSACGNRQNNYDASGTFEATEIMVPAQGNGIIEDFKINEGENLDSGTRVGFIDTTQ
ncbi:MAG: hypothetical protein ACTHJN_19200, partial [Ginsengibacter sp.]